MSVLTMATRFGRDFDTLCRGLRKGYSYNGIDLRKTPCEKRINALIEHTNSTIKSLEFGSGRKLEKFYIGKTFVQARGNHKKIDPTNVNTWKFGNGIGCRWRERKLDNYDGFVVLAAVTRKMLKQIKCDTSVWNQQDYALSLESALVTHYAFTICDHRLSNKSLDPGHKQAKEQLSAGHVVYLAYKYKETEEWKENTSKTEESDTEESQETEEVYNETGLTAKYDNPANSCPTNSTSSNATRHEHDRRCPVSSIQGSAQMERAPYRDPNIKYFVTRWSPPPIQVEEEKVQRIEKTGSKEKKEQQLFRISGPTNSVSLSAARPDVAIQWRLQGSGHQDKVSRNDNFQSASVNLQKNALVCQSNREPRKRFSLCQSERSPKKQRNSINNNITEDSANEGSTIDNTNLAKARFSGNRERAPSVKMGVESRRLPQDWAVTKSKSSEIDNVECSINGVNDVDSPEFMKNYRPIKTKEQCTMYTINFQADYEVYKALQNNMDCVAAKLSELKNEAQQFPKESMARQAIVKEILHLCVKVEDRQWQEAIKRCQELRVKLLHIKQLVYEYDPAVYMQQL